mgnify:CR=1 FL=1
MLKAQGKIYLSWDDIKNVIEKLAEKVNNLEKKPFYIV